MFSSGYDIQDNLHVCHDCSNCRVSDHRVWARAGVPVILQSTENNRSYDVVKFGGRLVAHVEYGEFTEYIWLSVTSVHSPHLAPETLSMRVHNVHC